MAPKTLKFLPANLRSPGVVVVVVVVVAENLHGIYYLFLIKTTYFSFEVKIDSKKRR